VPACHSTPPVAKIPFRRGRATFATCPTGRSRRWWFVRTDTPPFQQHLSLTTGLWLKVRWNLVPGSQSGHQWHRWWVSPTVAGDFWPGNRSGVRVGLRFGRHQFGPGSYSNNIIKLLFGFNIYPLKHTPTFQSAENCHRCPDQKRTTRTNHPHQDTIGSMFQGRLKTLHPVNARPQNKSCHGGVNLDIREPNRTMLNLLTCLKFFVQ